MANENKQSTKTGGESKALTIDEQLAAALKENEQLRARIEDLEKKFLLKSGREKLVLLVTKKGKGFYALEPFRDKGVPYSPGDKIDPQKLTNIIGDYIKKDLIYEVK